MGYGPLAMKARPHRRSAEDVRGLVAELGDLVEDLGLESAPAAPSPTAAPPQPPDGSAVPAAAAPMIDAVPMWEAAEEPAATLWEAFAPHLAEEAPRPWSPAAAMEVVEPASPPNGHPLVPAAGRAAWLPHPHLFTVVTALAVLVAAAMVIFSRLDLGHTSGPPQPVSTADFAVTGLRTVAASTVQQVATAPTLRRFPASVPDIYLDITYRNAAPSDELRVIIVLQPAAPGVAATTVSDESHRHLSSGGEIALTVEAPVGGFVPGTYTVRALYAGHLAQTWSFEVTAP